MGVRPLLPQSVLDEINAASPGLRDFIHLMETWDHSSQAFELFMLKEEVVAQRWTIRGLREELKKARCSESTGP